MTPARKFTASAGDPISERDLLERFPWIGASRLRCMGDAQKAEAAQRTGRPRYCSYTWQVS